MPKEPGPGEHRSPRNNAVHTGEWEKCPWCGPPAFEIERESAANLQRDLAKIYFDRDMREGKAPASGADYIIIPQAWDKAVKRLQSRSKSEPDALMLALLGDLGIPVRRVM